MPDVRTRYLSQTTNAHEQYDHEFMQALLADVAAIRSIASGMLSYSAPWDPPNILNAASAVQNFPVVGAAPGDFVLASFADLNGLQLTAYVDAADSVTVVLSNLTGAPVDLAQANINIRVLPKAAFVASGLAAALAQP